MKKYLRFISTFALRTILLFICIMMVGKNHAQVPAGVLNESERGYFGTLNALIDYLRQEKTPTAVPYKTGSNKGKEAFYDKIINTFFDREQMLPEFAKDSLDPAVKRKLDLLRQTLHQLDQSLDTLDSGAILIETYRTSAKPDYIEEGSYNFLTIRVRQGTLKTFVLTFFFDERTNKIIKVSGLKE